MNLEFLKFISWTALWAWVLSDSYARYVTPFIAKFYNALDEITNTDKEKGKSNYYYRKTITMSIEIIFSIFLAYIMISWSVWCLLRCVLYTRGFDVDRWVYFISGGICCELALGRAARALPHRNFFSAMPYIMGMGAFIVFSMNYEPIRTTFPWVIKFVGLESL